MATESRRQLPNGYTWQEIPEMRAAFPKPNGWFYRFDNLPGTHAFALSREEVRADGPRGIINDEVQPVRQGEGFDTGLSVNSFARVKKRTGRPAARIAQSMIEDPDLMEHTSPIQRISGKDLVTFRAYGISGPENKDGLLIRSRFYYEFTANVRTDRLYLIMFQAPTTFWGQYEETARIMVERRVLDRQF